MPVVVAKRKGKYRVVEAHTGKLAANGAETPVDGSGHATHAEAQKQCNAINASMQRKGGI